MYSVSVIRMREIESAKDREVESSGTAPGDLRWTRLRWKIDQAQKKDLLGTPFERLPDGGESS